MLRHLTCASSHVQSAYVAAAGDHELRAKLHAIGVNISSAIRTVIEERTT